MNNAWSAITLMAVTGSQLHMLSESPNATHLYVSLGLCAVLAIKAFHCAWLYFVRGET